MKYSIAILTLLSCNFVQAQVVKPDVQKMDQWTVVNRTATTANENGMKAIIVSEAANDGLVILNNTVFINGTIEFDVKGANKPGQSFVGLAFHVSDEKNYEAIYFRPFNFLNPDTVRKSHSVQYISMPGYHWNKLRTEHPGVYENYVTPIPDPEKWFHAKVVVSDKNIKVYVNHSATASLEVTSLSKNNGGKIAFWTGDYSAGSFANLVITHAR